MSLAGDLRPAALLLEIEGVLANTRHARRAALATALAGRGLALDEEALASAADARAPAVAAERAAAALARGAADPSTSRPPLDAVDVELLAVDAGRAFAERAAHGVTLVPGAREAVRELAARVRILVVTRAPSSVAEQLLGHAGLDGVVSGIVAAEQVAAPKPSPAAHLRALARLARLRPLTPTHVVALEDGPDGLAAARAAGVIPLGVGPWARVGVAGDAERAGPRRDAWVATIADVPYDALVRLVDSREEARGS